MVAADGAAGGVAVAEVARDVDFEEDDDGSWGNFVVNLYYAVVNLGIMLGSLALLMVSYWLLKWATVSYHTNAYLCVAIELACDKEHKGRHSACVVNHDAAL